MRSPLGITLMIAAALAAGASVPAPGADPGNVNGLLEQPLVTQLVAIRALEQEAKNLSLAAPQTAPLPAGTAAMVTDKVNQALAQLAALKTAITAGGPYQDSTLADKALKDLTDAEEADASCVKKIMGNRNASSMVYYLDKAEENKGFAQRFIMGLKTVKKDAAAIAANNISSETAFHDGDLKSSKEDVEITREQQEEALGDFLAGRGWVALEKLFSGEELSVASSSVASFKPVPNHYYAFTGTGSTAGYWFKSFNRQLFGPFETRFQVGAFDFNATEDTGSACIEFDVQGSSPLQFVAVCGRRVSGGVQVFVQSHDGPAGSLFLPSTRIAQVLVDYSGTAFTVKAASGKFAPDFVLNTVGTVNLTQGETALVAGMGASGLTKGAVIGLDEIYITAK